uniref:DUF4371 domain-containing protein n=1 Tax=Pelodiscus sinensis TaxID=13735 RepID=K7FTZ9_PELSI
SVYNIEDIQCQENEKKLKRATFNRKYDSLYLKYGFIACGESQAPKTMCVLCAKMLSNEAMKPSNLQHSESKHPALKKKKKEFEGQKQLFRNTTCVSSNVAALKASFLVAHQIAKAKKPFTIAKELILLAAKGICSELFREVVGQVSVSDNTVSKMIDKIAEDIEEQLLDRINSFSVQVDESTNIENKAMMTCMKIYCVCFSYLNNTTGAEIFRVLIGYISAKLNWTYCVGVCTDGTAMMTGRLSGFTTSVQEVVPECDSTHCVIHCKILASRKLCRELLDVLHDVIRIVNYIKTHPLNSCLFEFLCKDMDAEHKQLLLHTEVHWLLRGKVLTKVFKLREQPQWFLADKNSPLAAHFNDKIWLAKRLCLSNRFTALNKLSLSLQERIASVFKMADKITAFKTKLERIFDMFHTFVDFSEAVGLSKLLSEHLMSLLVAFDWYFPNSKDPKVRKEWIHESLIPNKESSLPPVQEDQLIELASDRELKNLFNASSSLSSFWSKVKCDYSELSTLKTLLPFPSTCLCEMGFSAMTATKTKH